MFGFETGLKAVLTDSISNVSVTQTIVRFEVVTQRSYEYVVTFTQLRSAMYIDAVKKKCSVFSTRNNDMFRDMFRL